MIAAILAAPAAAQAARSRSGRGARPASRSTTREPPNLAWNGAEPGSPPHFCRLPRGATACDVATTLPIAANTDTLSRPFVRLERQPGRHRCAPLRPAIGDPGLYVDGPRRRLWRPAGHRRARAVRRGRGRAGRDAVGRIVGRRSGALVQNIPVDGPAPTPFATLFDTTRPYLGTVGLVGATPLAIFTTGSSIGAFRRYDGSGDLNAQANWAPAVEIGYRRLSAPRGRPGPGCSCSPATRAEDSSFVAGTGRPSAREVTITTSGDASEMSLFQDTSGRLHAVYPRGSTSTGGTWSTRPPTTARPGRWAASRSRPTTSRSRCARPRRRTTSASWCGRAVSRVSTRSVCRRSARARRSRRSRRRSRRPSSRRRRRPGAAVQPDLRRAAGARRRPRPAAREQPLRQPHVDRRHPVRRDDRHQARRGRVALGGVTDGRRPVRAARSTAGSASRSAAGSRTSRSTSRWPAARGAGRRRRASRSRASCGATGPGGSAPPATTRRPPCAAPAGSCRTRARARARG